MWARILTILLLLGSVARAEEVEIPGPDGVALRSQLFRPAGPVRGAAIVLLHGCGGPFPSRDKQWTELFLAAGHVVLLPDSFASRGLGSQCNTPERDRIATASGLRRRDALSAASWLAAQPDTRPGGVVVMGWSDGGSTTLAAGRDLPDVPRGLIRGLVTFYPGCTAAARTAGWKPVAPLLILMGEADDWTPAAPCHELADKLGHAVTLVTYPDTYHDFDAPNMPVRTRGSARGLVHVGTNPDARTDALARVPAFIAGLP